MARVLVTGGAGYIGSHVCLELLTGGHEVLVVDNLCNGSPEALRRVSELTGAALPLVRCDVRDEPALETAFANFEPTAVMHFAALKAVGESVEQPLRYYENNVVGSLVLARVLARAGVERLVFSSSATVYGVPAALPATEEAPLAPTNPYGRSKAMMEQILADAAAAAEWRVVSLRYFNPVGAHPSGRIGEDPRQPNNLLPFVAQVASGKRDEVVVFGNDWPTSDGTGVRDYVHVVDLARAHVAALDALTDGPSSRCYNLGTGRGHSVLEVLDAFGRATGTPVPYEIGPRRPGDVAELVADPSRAADELGWRAERDLDAMCADAWRWQQANPDGY